MADETGWLIECGGHNAAPLQYFDGLGWTADHMEAIRFSRKIDGERIAVGLDSEHQIRVVEHMWTAQSTEQGK